MIQMDIPAAYVCAQTFAYCGRRWLADEKPSWSSKASLLATAYALGFIGSCGLFLFSGWTEWEMMYWLESVRMDTANFGRLGFALVGPMFLTALGVSAALGFKVAHRWILRGESRKVLISLWLGVAVSVGMILITPSAPMLVGHYHDYHAFVREALDSGNPGQYGLLALGKWTACVPWSVPSEALTKHSLIIFFNPRFFIPWLIDMLIFAGSAYAMARYFGPAVRVTRSWQSTQEQSRRFSGGHNCRIDSCTSMACHCCGDDVAFAERAEERAMPLRPRHAAGRYRT